MALIISLGIAVAVVAYVAAPFFLGVGRATEGGGSPSAGAPEPLRELLAEKESLYAAIQELDFDHQSGKLSAADHQSLRGRYEAQAARLLSEIDALTGSAAGTPPAPRKRGRERQRA